MTVSLGDEVDRRVRARGLQEIVGRVPPRGGIANLCQQALIASVVSFATFALHAQTPTRPAQGIGPRPVRSAPAVRAPDRPRSLSAGVSPLRPILQQAAHQRTVILPPLPTALLDELKRQDAIPSQRRLRIGLGRNFDRPIVVNHETVATTEWRVLAGGWRALSIEVTAQGALGMRVHLESLTLPEGVRLIVYDPADPAPDETPVSARSLSGAREIWAKTIFSERVAVECQLPPGVEPSAVAFSVTGLSHVYRLGLPETQLKVGSCDVDATCYPEWAEQEAAVARIDFVDGGTTFLCTGCLVNDSDPNTFIDYFLTANHCIPNQKVASTLELFWFYQTSACNAGPPPLSSVPHTSGGADLLAGSSLSDFSFLQLRQPSPSGVFYMGWTTALPSDTETLTCVQHPEGSFTRISFGKTVSSDGDFWEVQWDTGITEPGSSGSPLFSAGKEIIGQLYGGSSSCSDPTGTDFFGRFDLTYDTIWPWIDSGPPPIPLAKGTYNGLFAVTNDFVNSGSFTLKVTARSTYSGSVQLGGRRYSFSGQLNLGRTTRIVPRERGSSSLRITMGSDPVAGADRLTGTISDGVWQAGLNADRAVFDSRTNPAALYAGRYTMFISGSDGDDTSPHGNGDAALTVDAGGEVTLRGSLADGTTLTRRVPLSKNGDWPLFASIYHGGGSVLGWLRFDTNQSPVGLGGSLSWFKPARPSDKLYPAGFAVEVAAVGSVYVPPVTHTSPVINLSIASVDFDGGGLLIPFTNLVTISSGNKVFNESSDKLSMAFVLSSGLFTGKIMPPGATRMSPFHGAILQNQLAGYGYFLGESLSGRVVLEP